MRLLRELRLFYAKYKIVMSACHSIEIVLCTVRKMAEVIFATFRACPLRYTS